MKREIDGDTMATDRSFVGARSLAAFSGLSAPLPSPPPPFQPHFRLPFVSCNGVHWSRQHFGPPRSPSFCFVRRCVPTMRLADMNESLRGPPAPSLSFCSSLPLPPSLSLSLLSSLPSSVWLEMPRTHLIHDELESTASTEGLGVVGRGEGAHRQTAHISCNKVKRPRA